MTSAENREWLTVEETAERLGCSVATVRRKLRAFELPASRQGPGSRAPWRIHAPTLERRLEAEERRKRLNERGVVFGYSDQGGPADERFVADIRRVHGPETAAAVTEVMARHELFERVAREMYDDPAVRQRFEELDEEERFEEEARELARRIRRAERLRERALEILDEEDEN